MSEFIASNGYAVEDFGGYLNVKNRAGVERHGLGRYSVSALREFFDASPQRPALVHVMWRPDEGYECEFWGALDSTCGRVLLSKHMIGVAPGDRMADALALIVPGATFHAVPTNGRSTAYAIRYGA